MNNLKQHVWFDTFAKLILFANYLYACCLNCNFKPSENPYLQINSIFPVVNPSLTDYDDIIQGKPISE